MPYIFGEVADTLTSSLYNCEKIKFCYFKPLGFRVLHYNSLSTNMNYPIIKAEELLIYQMNLNNTVFIERS